MQKISEICEASLLQFFFLNVNRKGIYVTWVRLKSKKAELKQRVEVLEICRGSYIKYARKIFRKNNISSV